MSLILAAVDRFFRLIFAFLFLLASTGNAIVSGIYSKAMPSTETTVSIRSSKEEPGLTAVGRAPRLPEPSHAAGRISPCETLTITTSGAVCDGHSLGFPEINLKDVLDGNSYLPDRTVAIFIPEKITGRVVYKDIKIVLQWKPVTPDFLQIYLSDYLQYWGNRIPYRLFWNISYELCDESCSIFTDSGESLPEDIEGLSLTMAADSNFNGVPASFWNVNIKP